MFKKTFKYYKSRCPPPDLNTMIHVNDSNYEVVRRSPFSLSKEIEKQLIELGLLPTCEWNIFELKLHPGLIVIQNPFTKPGSHLWMQRCLSEYPGPPNKSNLHNHNLLLPHENWWHICKTDPARKAVLTSKQRWVTLGYHHDWDSKLYSEENKTHFPEELAQLAYCIGKAVAGWEVIAQAAILNFYRLDSTLSGHTDHSEPNNTAPLISISFGQSAVFLIGGKTIDDPTSALLINSGDVIIMSGESRLSYHGVPRIISVDWEVDDGDEYRSFLKEARINLNMRQVLFQGQTSL